VRPRLTALVIVGVLAIGVAAAVDALPEREDDDSHPTTSAPSVGEAVAALRTAGIGGVLTYSDDECRLHAVRLPSLRPTPAPRVTSCEPHYPTGGITTWEGDVVWSGLGFGTIQVVLPRERVDRAVSRRFGVESLELRARQAVSLPGQLYVVLAEGDADAQYLAFFDGRRLSIAYRLPAGNEEVVLRPSPRGRYVALRTPGRPGVSVFTRFGARVLLPQVASPRTIAWSPEDNWTALATLSSIYVFRSEEEETTLPRIPLAVRDLDWDA
jgi:hypothetical protein